MLSGITVTGGATVQAANGIHVDAYLGDVHVTAAPAIDASDALDAQKVASGAATGFAAYTLLDPAIIGNVGQNISVDAAAVTNLFSKAAHLAVPRIPSIRAAVTTVSVSGADPTLSLVGGVQANGIVSVLVLFGSRGCGGRVEEPGAGALGPARKAGSTGAAGVRWLHAGATHGALV